MAKHAQDQTVKDAINAIIQECLDATKIRDELNEAYTELKRQIEIEVRIKKFAVEHVILHHYIIARM
jgi:hypothetical protein